MKKSEDLERFRLNTIGICDGITMEHSVMKYSLLSQELMSYSVETMVGTHKFDAVICLANCDKIVPGMMMAMLSIRK